MYDLATIEIIYVSTKHYVATLYMHTITHVAHTHAHTDIGT